MRRGKMRKYEERKGETMRDKEGWLWEDGEEREEMERVQSVERKQKRMNGVEEKYLSKKRSELMTDLCVDGGE